MLNELYGIGLGKEYQSNLDLVNPQTLRNGSINDRRCFMLWIPESSGRDRWECKGTQVVLDGEIDRISITGFEQFRVATFIHPIDRTDGE